MGVHTGKVLDYATCNKICRQCQVCETTGQQKAHDCRVNYSGSAKGMEASCAVKMFTRSGKNGITYDTLIGDDDSSTLARLRSQVNPNIKKVADKTHVKRSFGGHLIDLKPRHKELTQKVIGYLTKCFTYALSQNIGDPVGLSNALMAIPKHAFGDHSLCDKSWCGYLNDPSTYRHKELPHGRDLSSKDLQDDIQTLILQYKSNAEQLCQPGSSQRNEALNSTIGSKTPKIRHYGSSFSNDV